MLTWPVGSGAASGGEGSVSVSSNHNLLPGLPPLEGHGSAGDTPAADDSPRGITARQRAVSAWEPAGEPPPADPFAYGDAFSGAPDGMGQPASRPWPPTPATTPAVPFIPGQSGTWTGAYPGETPDAVSGVRQTTKQPAVSMATGGWAAISSMMQVAGRAGAQANGSAVAWESDADLLDLCRIEIEHVLRELDELRVLIKQSSKELEKLNQRKVLTASKVREMEEHLEHHARNEIRTTYLEANEAEMRAFMISEQRDQMEAKLRVFERYAQFLNRALDTLPALAATQALGSSQHGGWPAGASPGWESANPLAAPPLAQQDWQLGPVPMPALPAGEGVMAGLQSEAITVARVIEAQESVRQRLAMRLHDGPTQSLANVMLTAEICEKLFDSEPAHAKSELANLKGMVNTALQETRKFIFELRPMTLDDLGLIATLKRYATDIAVRYQVQVPVTAPGGERRLPQEVEVPVFRVAQEAITNAVEHSRATVIRVSVTLPSHGLVLAVEDNGSGFDVEPELARARTHARMTNGIASMQERAELLGGWLRIESTAGRGTRVELSVPL
jgi:two-component system, NarL family, sensor histidine kinase DegS